MLKQHEKTKLEALKICHERAVREMLAAIDKANDLKCQIWAIETERLKDEV